MLAVANRSLKLTPGLYQEYVRKPAALALVCGDPAQIADQCRTAAADPEHSRAIELAKAAWWQSVADAQARTQGGA